MGYAFLRYVKYCDNPWLIGDVLNARAGEFTNRTRYLAVHTSISCQIRWQSLSANFQLSLPDF